MSAVLSSPAPVVLSLRRLSNRVDELGAINAQIAELQLKADAIKGILKCSGLDEVSGRVYRAVITTADVTRLDAKKVRAMLKPAQIAKCSVTTESVRVALYDL